MIEILHVRDPDFACDMRVWVDGVEVTEFHVGDVDPGAGYTVDDWDETTAEAGTDMNLSAAFRAAWLDVRTDYRDSRYVTED